MTDSYHYQIEPEPRVELNRGEFVLTADGGLHRRTHWDHVVTLSAADVSRYGWSDVELLARHLERLDYKRRDSIVFPSGAAVLTSGDKIVGRVEAETESLTDLIKRVFGHPTPTQQYAVDPNASMKVRDAGLYPSRAPLPHFNQRTEFDAFPDYVVFHEFEPTSPLYDSPTTDSAYPAIAGLLRG